MKLDTRSPQHQKAIRPADLALSDRLVVVLMFLVPIPSFLGEAAARAADLIRFGAVSGHLLLSPQLAWGSHVCRISVILLSMFFCACLSMFFGISHSVRDLLDVLRIAAFWTVFLYGASLARRGRTQPNAAAASCLKLLLAIGVLNALFTLSQYLFPDLTRPIQELFAVGDRHMELLSDQGRAFGFFINPNTNAIMVLLLALPGLALFQLTNQKRYLVYGMFVFATVLLTASRTGLVVAAVMGVVLCIASRRLLYLVALATIAWGAYEVLDLLVESGNVKDWFPYLSELLVKIHGALHGAYFDLGSINSFSGRLTIWEQSLDWYHINPLLGSGPLREVIPSFADNFYIYLLSRYGMVGLSLYVLFSVYMVSLSLRAILSRRRPQQQWGMVVFAAFVVVNVANYTVDAFLIVPIAMVTLLYAGYLACLMDITPLALDKGRSVRPVHHTPSPIFHRQRR